MNRRMVLVMAFLIAAISLSGVSLRSQAQSGTPAATEEVNPCVSAFTLLNLNTSTGEEFLTIPGMNARMVREYNEYRPYISIAQFRKEIGKYVSAEQVAAWEKYVYVPVQV